jgi:hypothetical protein
MINKDNFYLNTKAEFIKTSILPDSKPDYISYSGRKFWAELQDFDYTEENEKGEIIGAVGIDYDEDHIFYEILEQSSYNNKFLFKEHEKISSEYWYIETGVFRRSSHWGECASCEWDLNQDAEGIVTGFCAFEDFKLIN